MAMKHFALLQRFFWFPAKKKGAGGSWESSLQKACNFDMPSQHKPTMTCRDSLESISEVSFWQPREAVEDYMRKPQAKPWVSKLCPSHSYANSGGCKSTKSPRWGVLAWHLGFSGKTEARSWMLAGIPWHSSPWLRRIDDLQPGEWFREKCGLPDHVVREEIEGWSTIFLCPYISMTWPQKGT